jgi:NAD(P)-dependent dehydrogenase (short-subunit alcohol dehydrogenase family)
MRLEDRAALAAGTGMRLKDKVCIVTGAASGIGKEIALTFAREGGKVAIADLNKGQAQAVADEISGAGSAAIAVGMDVTDEAQVQRAVADVVARYGGVDVLVSNAGIQIVHPVCRICRLRAAAAVSFTWARCTPRKRRCLRRPM